MLEDEVVETLESSDEPELSLKDSLKANFEEVKAELPADDAEPVAEEATEEAAPEVKYKAPDSWSVANKAKFAELPADIQSEIVRREEDVHRGFTKFDEERVLGKQVKDVINPYLPMIRAEGGNVTETIGNMLQTAHMLRNADNNGRLRAIEAIVNKYQIDLRPLIQQQFQPQNHYIDPTVQQLQDQVRQLTQFQQNQYEMVEQQEQAQIHSTIESFASNPDNVFFEDVKPDMAILLKEGRAQTMEEAYDMACWARPDIRPLLLQAQQKQAQEVSRSKVQKARNAAVSVAGSPSGSSVRGAPQDRTAREEIAANLRALQGRIYFSL